MGRKVTLVLALVLAVPIGLAVATTAPASALRPSINASGTVSCSGAVGSLKFAPPMNLNGPFSQSETINVNTDFTGCNAHASNVTESNFTGRATGTISVYGNDCQAFFYHPLTVSGSLDVKWRAKTIDAKLNPSAIALSQISTIGSSNGNVGVHFQNQPVAGSFSGGPISAEMDSDQSGTQLLTDCILGAGLKKLTIVGGDLVSATPSLQLSPTSGPDGSTFAAAISGFEAGENVNLTFGGTPTGASCTADSSGSCTAGNITVPPVLAGTYPVTATGQTSGVSATATFTKIASTHTVTFNYNGTNGSDGTPQTWTVPAGVTNVTVVAAGAQGADLTFGSETATGGLGGTSSVSGGVSPGEVLSISVGGQPSGSAAGFNGGGGGGGFGAGGGGGASDVSVSGIQAVIGGGGGGPGIQIANDGTLSGLLCGGAGGGPVGLTPPTACNPTAGDFGPFDGQGATSSVGGTGGQGTPGGLGNGIQPVPAGGAGGPGVGGAGSIGGGGGGGLQGGGGGGGILGLLAQPIPLPPPYIGFLQDFGIIGSGGGGSGFSIFGCTASPTCTSGVNAGNGYVTITYVS